MPPRAARQEDQTLPAGADWGPFGAGALIAERYRLVKVLGRGGMGEVWEALHDALGRAVALKLVRVEAGEMRDRLLHEARVLAQLTHPSIVSVYDAGEAADGTAYLAMELLAGDSLAKLIEREGRVPVARAVGFFVSLLSGLQVAHEAGIIHRDVKPDNILLVPSGAGQVTPRLIDFGIAVPANRDPDRSTDEDWAGTPEYMAPEQLRGLYTDPRSDVWSVCVSLYESITGRPPFLGRDLVDTARNVAQTPLSYPRDVPDMDGALWAILTKGMRKKVDERFSGAAELADALQAWLLTAQERGAQSSLLSTASAPAFAPATPSAGGAESPRAAMDDIISKKLREV